MKVTAKGQVTIPFEVREQLDIRPGAEVKFEIEGNAVRIIPVRKSRLNDRRNRELLARIDAAYAEEPDDEERAVLRYARRQQRRITRNRGHRSQ